MNSILEAYKETCVMLVSTSKPDGYGGYITAWNESFEFDAAFDFQSSLQAKLAQAQGVTGLWDIYVSKTVPNEYHNVFRRKSDGLTYRVTSLDDKATPKGAGLNLKKVSAEEWELTNNE